jgi:hypothetical protein
VGLCMPLKVRTHNEAVTLPLLGEADLSRHILGKSANLSWALLFQEDRVIEEKEQGEVELAPKC